MQTPEGKDREEENPEKSEDLGEALEETSPDSYEIVVTRAFEMDLTTQQVMGLMQQTGSDSPQEAVEEAFLERERHNVEPEQKLLGVNVEATTDG